MVKRNTKLILMPLMSVSVSLSVVPSLWSSDVTGDNTSTLQVILELQFNNRTAHLLNDFQLLTWSFSMQINSFLFFEIEYKID